MTSELSSESAAIIVAAGKGVRFGSQSKKQYSILAGHPVLAWSIFAFIRAGYDKKIIVVADEEEIAHIKEKILGSYSFANLIDFTSGGSTRQQSVFKGIDLLPPKINWVAIHDAARPLVKVETIKSAFQAALIHGAALTAIPATDSTFIASDMKVDMYLDRKKLWQAQTPQVFRKVAIIETHKKAQSENFTSNDDATLYRKYIGDVKVVQGDITNIKITFPHDLTMAEEFLKEVREYPY
ncbi:2-C-methyl-D-erythritol 4-phosphate cytidylyltransferase [candidate division KSB1 bacterium]|nr:2-C-methyl-D-erythritol 4-phosphate cytidylyltransferase [candidate division KSB1 bacterium]